MREYFDSIARALHVPAAHRRRTTFVALPEESLRILPEERLHVLPEESLRVLS